MGASKFIENAVKHVYNAFDVSSFAVGSPERLFEYANENSGDRRYKIHILAADSSFRSGIVKWRGTRYYFYQDALTGEVETEISYR